MKKIDLSDYDISQVPSGAYRRFSIIVSEWNADITNDLLDAAYSTLLTCGTPKSNIMLHTVPGSFELTTAANHLLNEDPTIDAVICLGCVIQGETRHFDFICEAVANGLTQVSLRHDKPVIFGVLTTNTFEQAQERAGGSHGNKGVEAAIAALKMAELCA